MKTYNSKAIICVKDQYNFEYRLCTISYFLNDDESFKYVFEPNYSIISLTSAIFFQGIPGLNLDLHKKEYIRDNVLPTFISERVPNKNREDYHELLAEVNMSFMDPLLYLIKTNKYYSGDYLYLIPYEEKEEVLINNLITKDNTTSYIKKILNNITKGNNILINNEEINDENRKLIYNILINIYSRSLEANKIKQLDGITIAKNNNKYKGRKPLKIDKLKFLEVLSRVKNKEITSKEAANLLNISIDKFYREKNKLQK